MGILTVFHLLLTKRLVPRLTYYCCRFSLLQALKLSITVSSAAAYTSYEQNDAAPEGPLVLL